MGLIEFSLKAASCFTDGGLWGNCETDRSFLWGHSKPDGKNPKVPQDALHIYSIDTTVSGAFGCEVFFLLCAFYQSMLKDDEFFKEISNSPNPSVTDEDSNAWDCWHHQIWSCCEWNSVPTLSTCTQTCLNKVLLSAAFKDEPKVLQCPPVFSFKQLCWESLQSNITLELCCLCRLMKEETFRATSLLACQLVSGDILYSVVYWHLWNWVLASREKNI